MTTKTELRSWLNPPSITTSPAPEVGSKAPTTSELSFPNGKPTIITFLRHCGCPFSEKSFKELRTLAQSNKDIEFIAVSHSDEQATKNWVEAVGGAKDIKVVVDSDRDIYSKWGLGTASFFHIFNAGSFYNLFKVGKQDGIWNRPTESGYRWQTSGNFAVDKDGIVRFSQVAKSAHDIPDFSKVLETVTIS